MHYVSFDNSSTLNYIVLQTYVSNSHCFMFPFSAEIFDSFFFSDCSCFLRSARKEKEWIFELKWKLTFTTIKGTILELPSNDEGK